MKWIYQCFLVVISFGIDTNNHFDFSLSIKVVLEQMGYFRVSVGNHLWKKNSLATWFLSECCIMTVVSLTWWFIPCLCRTSGSPEVLRCRSAESAKTGWCYLQREAVVKSHVNFAVNDKIKSWRSGHKPASRIRVPSAPVLPVRSLPAKSTRQSWLTVTWLLSWQTTSKGKEKKKSNFKTGG